MKNGKCDAAIVGACNAAIFEEFQQIYNEMGLLSPDCKTKAFDANGTSLGFLIILSNIYLLLKQL